MNNLKRLVTILGVAALLVSVILFGVWFFRDRGKGHLVWERPVVKKSIQTFAYKIYGNSSLSNGRFFLSKLVARNTGTKPVTDFSVSYQIRGYLDWTTPETLPQIPPGNTVIKCFYPQLPMKVTEIKNATPSALEIKIRWNDGKNPVHEEVLREEFVFRGVNEIEYTDLPANEIIGWRDEHVNFPLLAAMVTPNDPVVKEFAAAITEKLGGAVAGASHDDKDKLEVMAGTYNYMLETGMRYAGGGGFPEKIGDTVTYIQNLRLPRDVILTNHGLCMELTTLWASVLEHLGIRSSMCLVPGHAFIVVPMQGNSLVAIECTAITPKAVDSKGPVSFADATKIASKEFQQFRQARQVVLVDAKDEHAQGITPPELQEINLDEVKRIIASRKPQSFFPIKGQIKR